MRCPLSVIVSVFFLLPPAATQAAPKYNIYWGDVHGHTGISDGKGTVDDYFTYARDTAGLDFVIVTDHDFGNAAPWRMPKENWTLTQDKAAEYTVNGKFVAMAGYEWTSQPKYWTPQEQLFRGPPKYYNHKNVYFPSRTDYIFSASDSAFKDPDLLAEAVKKHGGLIHNCHPDAGTDGSNQFDYDPQYFPVIVNTEIWSDLIYHDEKKYDIKWETAVRNFLDKGGRTGFVRGTDTHEGNPAARTAILAPELSRSAIFDALRHRRNYAVSNARIVLDFKVNGHPMGAEIQIHGKPTITAEIRGTDRIREAVIIRNGSAVYSLNPDAPNLEFRFIDESMNTDSYYYLRVTQVDTDEHGNPSCAWSSPIWVTKK